MIKLDLSKELFMTSQAAQVVTQTPEGSFVVKGVKTGRVVIVDQYGKADGKLRVWNKGAKVTNGLSGKFKAGDYAYKVRLTLTRNPVEVGKVVAVQGDRVWVSVEGKKSPKHPQGLFQWFMPYLLDSYEKVETYLQNLEQAVYTLPPPVTILRKANEK